MNTFKHRSTEHFKIVDTLNFPKHTKNNTTLVQFKDYSIFVRNHKLFICTLYARKTVQFSLTLRYMVFCANLQEWFLFAPNLKGSVSAPKESLMTLPTLLAIEWWMRINRGSTTMNWWIRVIGERAHGKQTTSENINLHIEHHTVLCLTYHFVKSNAHVMWPRPHQISQK